MHRFFRFILGTLRTLRREGISNILVSFRYWKSTSPFIANLKSKNKKLIHKSEQDVASSQFNQSGSLEKTKYYDNQLCEFLKLGFMNLRDSPLVSIIIPTYDQVDYLKKCLRSIENNTSYKNYEIIIVTNNLDSNSEMRRFLSSLRYRVELYRNEFSFGLVNNFAVSKSNGDFCVFLNDDTEIISKDWLENFLFFINQKNVAAVGGKILYSNNKLQEAGGIVWNNGNVLQYGKFENPDESEFNFVRDVDYCSACFLIVKKTIFQRLGGFDSRFTTGYYEDTDLCLAFRENGFRVIYQPKSQIIHYEGKTFSKRKNLHQQLLENKDKFIKKWNYKLKDFYPENLANIKLASDKRTGLDILYLIEIQNQIGISQRNVIIASILAYLGNKITIIISNSEKNDKSKDILEQRGICVIVSSHENKFVILERNIKNYNIVILTSLQNTREKLKILAKKTKQCKIVLDGVEANIGELLTDEESPETAFEHKSYDKKSELIKQSDLIIVSNEKEILYLNSKFPSQTFVILSIVNSDEFDVSYYKNVLLILDRCLIRN